MLCRLGDLTKDDIGAIRVQDSHTFVEVLESSSARFTNALGPDMKGEDGAVITKLDKAPDLPRGGPKRGPKPEWKSGGGNKRFDKDGPRKPRKTYDSDAPSKPHKAKPQHAEAPRGEYKPRDEAPRKPKGERPPKSHKTERSPMKPGAKPKAKAEESGQYRLPVVSQ